MKIIRKTKILVNTKRELKISQIKPQEEFVVCPQCGETMIEARLAAEILRKSIREIYRMIEADSIHFYETDDKHGFLCLQSAGK